MSDKRNNQRWLEPSDAAYSDIHGKLIINDNTAPKSTGECACPTCSCECDCPCDVCDCHCTCRADSDEEFDIDENDAATLTTINSRIPRSI